MGRTFRLRRGAGYLAAILCSAGAVTCPHSDSTPASGVRAARPPVAARCGVSVVARTPEVCASTVGPHPAALAIDAPAGRVFVLDQGTGRQHGDVSVLDAATGAVLHTTPVGQPPVALAVDARAHRVVVLSAGATAATSTLGIARITTLDAHTGRPLRRASSVGLRGPIAAAGRRGRFFAIRAGATGYRLAMLDATSLTMRQTSPLPPNIDPPLALAVDQQHRRVFVVWTAGEYGKLGAVSVFDATTGAVIAAESDVGPQPGAVVVDGARGLVFVAHQNDISSSGFARSNGGVRVLDATGGGFLADTGVSSIPVSMAEDTPARRLYVLNKIADPQGNGSIDVLQADHTGRIMATFPLGTDPPDTTAQTPIALAVATRMRRLYVLYDHASGTDPRSPGAVWVVDAGTGAVRHIVVVGHMPSALLADPLTGRVFVTNAGDNTVSVLDAAHL